jgi:hypothetical protein
MIQTLEAVVNESGKIELLTEIRLKKRQRALVTILDEEPKVSDESKKEKLLAAFKKAQKAKLFQDIENPVEWQRKLRDEWD